VIVAPIINIINKIEVILVNTPIIRKTPPINSNNPTGSANAAGNQKLLANKASVPVIFASLGKPFIMNPIPAMILIGNSPNDITLYISIM
jgi:hypothetical protein